MTIRQECNTGRDPLTIIMAHFYAEAQGSRGAVHRLGGAKGGARTSCNGWNSGISVYAYVNADGKDCFTIELTAGSGGGKMPVTIAEIVDGQES